jgi:hypothetical protein
MILAIILFLIIWTVISIWYFLSIMGYKYRKQKWYDYPLLVPAGLICVIIGWLGRMK